MHIEMLKADLRRRMDWTVMRAYSSIDVARDGFLSFGSVLNFCRINGYNAIESEIIAIVRRLDADADQKIGFDEFCQIFQGTEQLPFPSHADASSPVREDPYFRHTSPPKQSPRRSRSPLRSISPPQRQNNFEE